MSEREECAQYEDETSRLISASDSMYGDVYLPQSLPAISGTSTSTPALLKQYRLQGSKMVNVETQIPYYGATDQATHSLSTNFDTSNDVPRNQTIIYSRGKSIDKIPTTHDLEGFGTRQNALTEFSRYDSSPSHFGPTAVINDSVEVVDVACRPAWRTKGKGKKCEDQLHERICNEQCNFEFPCRKCKEDLASAKLSKQPCQKLSLHTVVPFRPGNSRAGETQSSFPKLAWCPDDPRLRTTFICQDFCLRNAHPVPTIPVTCRRFIPGPSDVLVEPYKASDGEVMFVTSPPYACVDIDTPKMRGALGAYIKECRPFISKDVMATISDDIYKFGLLEAERFVRKREDSIVSLALEILACVHVNFKQAIMVGVDTLDVSPVMNEKFSIHGTSPVPSVLDYQIDTLYIYHMRRLTKEVCKGLKKLIFTSNNTANWYEIFLTVFVLLVSLEQVYMAQIRYLQLNNKPRMSHVTQYMISEWRHSAKNLLYHFRCVLKGMIPFSPSWDPIHQNQVELDQESVAYIKKMSKILGGREAELLNLREGLDNIQARPLTWLVELFLDDRLTPVECGKGN